MSAAVDVVIATYNYGRFLGAAIESVRAQSFEDWKLIVVDDGSTDDTQAVLNGFRHDPRIWIHTGPRRGPAAARNIGIELATAPFVAFLDADDGWMPIKLACQLPLFDDPRVGVVYSRRLLMGPAGEAIPFRQPPLFRGDVLKRMFRDNFVCFSTTVVRRELLEQVGGFGDVPLAVDYELLLKLAGICQFDYVEEPLVCYRTGHTSLSTRKEDRLHVALSIMDRAVADYGDRLPEPLVRQAYAETLAKLGLVSRDRSRASSLVYYARAIQAVPGRAATWKELASLFLPEGARRLARRAMGKPVEWKRPLAAETTQPSSSSAPMPSLESSEKLDLNETITKGKDSPLERGQV